MYNIRKGKNKIINMFLITFKKQTITHCRILLGEGKLFINKKTLNTFFNKNLLLLEKLKILNNYKKIFNKYNIYITVKGGGLETQFQTIVISFFKLLIK